VLFSGGLDSGVLLADEADLGEVQPVYISAGLSWERAERAVIGRFLTALSAPHAVRPLLSLTLDMTDVYTGTHWAVTGRPPAYHTPDEDVYLPGRNVVLLAKTAVLCASAGITRIAIGTLAGNPFPDATPAFRRDMARALSSGLERPIEIVAPYEMLHKDDLVRRAVLKRLPVQWTLSCMNPPLDGPLAMHCGVCSKCRERHDAFVASGCDDPTIYLDRSHIDA
jgi:7-cyano-7-deazaguanine synthase